MWEMTHRGLRTAVVTTLLAAITVRLAEGCCVSESEPKNVCVLTKNLPTPKRPIKDRCFFDPFENDANNVPQTISLTWAQARDVCRSLNTTLPLILSDYAFHMMRQRYMMLSRIWIGSQVEEPFRNVSHVDLDLADVNTSLTFNFTNWAKYEPNNAGCYEKCIVAFFDGTWNDYACDFIPVWDNCSDVIFTICHNSSNKNCIWYEDPKSPPTSQDWYIILAITFGSIFGAVMVLSSIRFIFEQCSNLSK